MGVPGEFCEQARFLIDDDFAESAIFELWQTFLVTAGCGPQAGFCAMKSLMP